MTFLILSIVFGISLAGSVGILVVRAIQLRHMDLPPHDGDKPTGGESAFPHAEPVRSIPDKIAAVFRVLHRQHAQPALTEAKNRAKIHVVRGVDILHELSTKAKKALEGKRTPPPSGENVRSPFFEKMSAHQMTGEQKKKIVRQRSTKKKAPQELPADMPVAGENNPAERVEKVFLRRHKKTNTEQ